MASFLILLLASFLGSVICSPKPLFMEEGEDAEHLFERFIEANNRNYVDENEKQARFQIFKTNLEEVIRDHNNSRRNNDNNRSYSVLAISQFMDLTLEEFRKRYLGLKPKVPEPEGSRNEDFDVFGCVRVSDEDIPHVDAPESLDWRHHGIVTPVKNQDQCGSCYAFAAIGNVESQFVIKYHRMISLSEQQILDCDLNDSACNGGHIEGVFRYLMQDGSVLDDVYPYDHIPKACQFNRFNASTVAVNVTSCRSYHLYSQEKLKQALYMNGPLAVAIQGDGLKNTARFGGIVSDEECDKGGINHAVLLVGYGEDEGEPYWLVKNSWGHRWGVDGYFRMHRGEGAKSCGVMTHTIATAVL